MNTATPQGAQAAVRVIRLLKAFNAAKPEMSLQELCQQVGLAKTTTYRLVNALACEGLVEKNEENGKYRLGASVLTLASHLLTGRNLVTKTHPVLETLSRETGETATLEVLAEGEVVILDEVDGNYLLGSSGNIGTRWPLHTTSTGKVFMAFSGQGTNLLRPPLKRYTENTITDIDKFSEILKKIKSTGYATTYSELEDDWVAVAAPIIGPSGSVHGALSIGGPVRRLDANTLDKLGERLKQAACSIM